MRKKGIIKDEPKKENQQEITIGNQVSNQEDDDIEKLLELDDDDDDVIAEYRRKIIAELKNSSDNSPRFGDLREITASDYVEQVNKAGDNIWVVLLLYERGYNNQSILEKLLIILLFRIPSCTLMCEYFVNLAIKFPKTKFLKSLASLCVANFPEKNLPAVFIYNSGVLIKQLVGTKVFNENLTFEGKLLIMDKVIFN